MSTTLNFLSVYRLSFSGFYYGIVENLWQVQNIQTAIDSGRLTSGKYWQ